MLDSEFLHLVNKYGADLPKEDANLYLRDACRCCWGIDDCDDKMAELSSRVDSYCYSAFPKMSSSDISKLSYSLCQCLAFEIGLIDYPDQHDVSYPGIGLIAESTLSEARSANLGTKEDFDAPLEPICTDPATGFTEVFSNIRQAAEWVINDDEGHVPSPFGTVKKSKYASFPWENMPKSVQNSIMNNILNAACRKETRADLEDRFRDTGYGLQWDLGSPEEIVSEDIRCSYEEGHGSKEDRDQIKVRISAEKAAKAAEEKNKKIKYVTTYKDWAIGKLKAFKNKSGESLFDMANCEPTYGYPEYGISGYFSGNFDKKVASIQAALDKKFEGTGKKPRSITKYFDYLGDVAADVGLKVDWDGTLKESLMKDFMRELEESHPSVDLIEETFRSLGRKSNSRRLYFTYVDTMTVTTEDGTVVPTKYSVPVTVSYEPDDSEFEGYDDSKVEIDIDPEFESKRDEVLEAVKTMLDDDPDIVVDICNEAESHLGNF